MVAAHRALLLRSLRYEKAEAFEVGRDLRDVVAWLEHTKVCLIHLCLSPALFYCVANKTFGTPYCSAGSAISRGCPRQHIRR